MKKTLLLSFAFACALGASAQITKGTKLLGGNHTWYKTTIETNNNTTDQKSYFLQPSFGIAVRDNVAFGVRGGYQSQDYGPGSGFQDHTYKGFTAGVFARRYAGLGSRFYVFGDGGLDFSRNKLRQTNTDFVRTAKTTGVTLGVSPGVTYAATRRLHLEVMLANLLSFGFNQTDDESNSLGGRNFTRTQNFNASVNGSAFSQLNIGFRIVL
ncbi:MAG TPA: outer membrane beta-barrel protein [Chitinophagaceae bacterium]|jgi:hypothetical protein|nr:outer membrane beta-barrel protein [Chitinophagaceae bacterium]